MMYYRGAISKLDKEFGLHLLLLRRYFMVSEYSLDN